MGGTQEKKRGKKLRSTASDSNFPEKETEKEFTKMFIFARKKRGDLDKMGKGKTGGGSDFKTLQLLSEKKKEN